MLGATTLERLSLLLAIATAILSPSLSAFVAATSCYHPDGSVASGDRPCGTGKDVACCGQGAVCLSNRLCLSVAQPYTLARASCTDETWTSGNCPTHCLQDSTFNQSGISIVLYTFLNGTGEYCCNNIIASNDSPICAKNYSRFTLDDASMIPGYDILADYVLANETSSSSSGKHAAAVGAGVGVPLGIIALASIVWALWERRKLNRLRAGDFGSGSAKQEGPYFATVPQAQPMHTDPQAYGQQQVQQHYNSQSYVLSELANKGPAELDSQ